MLLRIINIHQLPTSTILSCETEDAIPDRISGQYELRDENQVRQVVKIEGRVSVRELTEVPLTTIDIFTHETVQLTQEEAASGAFVLELAKTPPVLSRSPA
jgi:hypothetical protein